MHFNIILSILLTHILLCHVSSCCKSSNVRIIETMERIKEEGLTGEEHHVQTEDGYLLTMFRIPVKRVESSTSLNKNSEYHKLPVLLIHGVLFSSDMFLLDKDGFGFQLARQGFDVWLGNARGNAYSRRHTTLSPDDKEFWNFSWHEMGVYDVPAIMDYILDKTKEKQINYIGMCMGTTIFFVMGSMKPDYLTKVQKMVAIAPLAKLKNISELSNFNSSTQTWLLGLPDLWENNGKFELFPRADILGRSEHQIGCKDLPTPFSHYCCARMASLSNMIEGGPVPSGTSLKSFRHYMQLSTTGIFRAFDYGNEELNKKHWDEFNPPVYDLKRLTVPIAMFYTPDDDLTTQEDTEKTISELPNVIKVWKAAGTAFSNVEFLVTKNSRNVGSRMNMITEMIKLLRERSG